MLYIYNMHYTLLPLQYVVSLFAAAAACSDPISRLRSHPPPPPTATSTRIMSTPDIDPSMALPTDEECDMDRLVDRKDVHGEYQYLVLWTDGQQTW